MTEKKRNPPLHIDMDFEEALERFGTTDPKELPDNIKLSQKHKRKAGHKAQPARKDKD